MRKDDITTYIIGEHCFGPILEVNGIEYNDISKEDVNEFISDMLENDINSDSLRRAVFQLVLEHLQLESEESSSDSCEQCGNYNYTNTYKR